MSENTKVSITEESEACVVLKDRRFRRSRRVQLFNGVKVSAGQFGGHSVSELSEVPTIDKTFCDFACVSLMWLWALVEGVIL